jgi:hypothetical protein
MYEYDFVKLNVRGFRSEPRKDHRTVVKERAKDGWRLVQVFAPGTTMKYGSPDYFELIFERQVS